MRARPPAEAPRIRHLTDQLAELRDLGVITPEEFEGKKAKVLA